MFKISKSWRPSNGEDFTSVELRFLSPAPRNYTLRSSSSMSDLLDQPGVSSSRTSSAMSSVFDLPKPSSSSNSSISSRSGAPPPPPPPPTQSSSVSLTEMSSYSKSHEEYKPETAKASASMMTNFKILPQLRSKMSLTSRGQGLFLCIRLFKKNKKFKSLFYHRTSTNTIHAERVWILDDEIQIRHVCYHLAGEAASLKNLTRRIHFDSVQKWHNSEPW